MLHCIINKSEQAHSHTRLIASYNNAAWLKSPKQNSNMHQNNHQNVSTTL